MLEVKQLEASVRVNVNGEHHHLTSNDVDCVFWQTADLFDTETEGPAFINIGTNNVFLEEYQWHALYFGIEEHLNLQFEIVDLSHKTLN